MSWSGAAKDQRGFTLIEVMLAFTLLALMLLILYSSFALSSRAEERVGVRIDANEKIRTVEGLLAGYIRSAYPYRQAAGQAGIVFAGEAEKLNFISAVSVLSGERGLANITISFESDEQGNGVLKLQEALPVRLGGGQDEEGGEGQDGVTVSRGLQSVDSPLEGAGGESITNEVVLADKLTRVQISYLEVTEDTEEWLSEWDGTAKQQLPRAVRIILEAKGVEPAEWVFPIMVRLLTV